MITLRTAAEWLRNRRAVANGNARNLRHAAEAMQRRSDALFAAAIVTRCDPARSARLYCLSFSRSKRAQAMRLRAEAMTAPALSKLVLLLDSASHGREADWWETEAQPVPVANTASRGVEPVL